MICTLSCTENNDFEVWLSLSWADWGLALTEWVIKECKFWWRVFAKIWFQHLSPREVILDYILKERSWKISKKDEEKSVNSRVATLNSLLTNGAELCGYSGTKREDLIIWGAIAIHPNHFQNIKYVYSVYTCTYCDKTFYMIFSFKWICSQLVIYSLYYQKLSCAFYYSCKCDAGCIYVCRTVVILHTLLFRPGSATMIPP